jgi:hypothetical protein
MTERTLSGSQIGKRHADRLRTYIDGLRAKGSSLPIRNGRPNLTAIGLACGFDRQVLHKNPACRRIIEEATAEFGLQGPTGQPTENPSGTVRLEAKVLRLEQQNAALRVEVGELRRKLRQFQHIEEHMVETGRRIIP